MNLRPLLLAAVLALAPVAAFAQNLTVVGLDGKPTVFTADSMRTLERHGAPLRDGPRIVIYEGVALGALFKEAGVPMGPRLHGKPVSAYVVVTGQDGYRVVLSLAETDPAMRAGTIVLADTKDGGQLGANEGPWRMVVADDKKPERSVRQVVKIQVVQAP